MGKIHILDESVSNIIAAGEVVENPSSMLKELIENSIDAGANKISIEVKNGGRYVKIVDNGIGMDKQDLFLSIERHATSKIKTKEDIFNLSTNGFRGEALASISSVSKMLIASRYKDDEVGYEIKANGGSINSSKQVAMNIGTIIEVKDLFFNTPARLKFLRSKNTEYAKIKQVVQTQALVNYRCAFSLIIDNKLQIKSSGKDINNCILELFNKEILRNLIKVENGFIANQNVTRASRDYIFTYINGRYAKSTIIEKAVIDAYYTKLMKGRYPFAIIFLEIDPREIDVNVHPSKKIVKFSNDTRVYGMVKNMVEQALYENDREENSKLLDITSNYEKRTNTNVVESFKNEILIHDTKPLPMNYIKNDDIFIENKIIEQIPENEMLDFSKDEKIDEETVSNEDYRIIGQLKNMYILVENKDKLEIYDQHIVQERILYEQYKEEHYNKKIASQALLVPLKINLEPYEMDIVLNNKDYLMEFGFEVEQFGGNDLIIRSAPVFDFRCSISETFKNIVDELKNDSKMDIREKIIISMACQNSIKAGEKLKMDEMENLLYKLHKIKKYSCPHGRPIIVKIPMDDLDKMFGRK